MNFYLIAAGFVLKSKHFKILVVIMIALILIPAMGVVAVASLPQALFESLLHGNQTYSLVDPAPTGIVILGDFYFPGDNYEPGNCTYWAYARRAQVGATISNSWGNANTWDDNARSDGYRVDQTPAKYDVMQTDAGKLGHVGFVESIDPDGTWHISEMNVEGLYIVDHKAMPASAAKYYNFIHTKG